MQNRAQRLEQTLYNNQAGLSDFIKQYQSQAEVLEDLRSIQLTSKNESILPVLNAIHIALATPELQNTEIGRNKTIVDTRLEKEANAGMWFKRVIANGILPSIGATPFSKSEIEEQESVIPKDRLNTLMIEN